MSNPLAELAKNIELMVSNSQDAIEYFSFLKRSVPSLSTDSVITHLQNTIEALIAIGEQLEDPHLDLEETDQLLYSQLHTAVNELLTNALGRQVPFDMTLTIKPSETIH